MTKSTLAVSGMVAIAWIAADAVTPAAQVPAGATAQNAIIDQYCLGCHNTKAKAAGLESGVLTLDTVNLSRIRDDRDVWERVIRKVRAGMMPPANARRPDVATLDRFVGGLEAELDRNAPPHLPPPGLHRLNRAEYENVVRDLLGLDIDATKFLPPDDSTHGFDNMAGTLGMSPALLEAYVSAAGKISRLAIGTQIAPVQAMYPVPVDATQMYHVEGLPLGTRGGAVIRHHFPADGEYAIRVYPVRKGNMGGSGTFGGVRGEQVEVSLDGERVAVFDWDKSTAARSGSGGPGTIDLTLKVQSGLRNVGVAFVATHYAPLTDLNKPFLRTTIETGGIDGLNFFPHIASVRIAGPLTVSGVSDTESRHRVFVCRPAAATQERTCARTILANLANRAFRRPASFSDIDELVQLYAVGRNTGDFEHGIEMALRGVLAHPKFLYRVEVEPASVAAGQTYRISDYELASRMSFFLWSTMPDEQLMALAARGTLRNPAVLEAQVRRMLKDPRAEALAVNFAGQWLNLRGVQASAPAPPLYPDFDDNLRQAMRKEVELLFDTIVREDRSVRELLTADYTFVNERLARHYGIRNVYGSVFRRVTLDDGLDARRGLLGKGAFLLTTSQATRTSPVIRGKWVLSNIIGVPPPQPPANVPVLKAQRTDVAGNTKEPSLRQKMIDHRIRPDCVNCHKLMDPIGFALENFDAIGAWRTMDGTAPVDAGDVMYDSTKVDGVAGLRSWLLGRSDLYLRTVTEKLMTYALGRGAEAGDMPLIRSIVSDAKRNNERFSSLVLGIVRSAPFQMNRKAS
jgi:hypothetical protein